MSASGTVVVVGHGMVGHRFVEALRARDTPGSWRVVVLGEERRAAYDRVGLSSYANQLVSPTRSYAGRGSSPMTSRSWVSVRPRSIAAWTNRWPTMPWPTTTIVGRRWVMPRR